MNIKKTAIAAFVSLAVIAAAPKAFAAGDGGVGFSFGAGFYQAVDDRRMNGYNSNFSLDVQMTQHTGASLYREDLHIETDEVVETAEAPGDTKVSTDISVDIIEVRVRRNIIPDLVEVGLGFGKADIKTTHRASGLTNATVDRHVAVGDIYGRVTAINTNGSKINAKLYVDLGYRFMDIRSIDIWSELGGSGDALNDIELDDLSGFFGNLGASVLF